MKKLSLQPYPGVVYFCKDRVEYVKWCKKLFGVNDEIGDDVGGRTRYDLADRPPRFVMFAETQPYLVHELSHTVLLLFEYVNIDPRQGNGEPFCYMLSFLLSEVQHLIKENNHVEKFK